MPCGAQGRKLAKPTHRAVLCRRGRSVPARGAGAVRGAHTAAPAAGVRRRAQRRHERGHAGGALLVARARPPRPARAMGAASRALSPPPSVRRSAPLLPHIRSQVEGRVVLRFAAAYGFRNIQSIVRKLKRGKLQYDYIEVMACPSGAAHGLGRPLVPAPALPLRLPPSHALEHDVQSTHARCAALPQLATTAAGSCAPPTPRGRPRRPTWSGSTPGPEPRGTDGGNKDAAAHH